MKTCPKCNTDKQSCEFSKSKKSKDGLAGYCKECMRVYHQNRNQRLAKSGFVAKEKLCRFCERTLSADNFSKNKSKKDGLDGRCKDCLRVYAKEVYYRDIELSRKRIREANARAYATPEGRIRLQNNAYRWGKNNPDALKAIKHSRRSENIGKLDPLKWRERLDFYGGKCIYCGTSENITIEHRIPVSRGGTNLPANLAPACKSCNCKKNTKTEFEFKALLSKEK